MLVVSRFTITRNWGRVTAKAGFSNGSGGHDGIDYASRVGRVGHGCESTIPDVFPSIVVLFNILLSKNFFLFGLVITYHLSFYFSEKGTSGRSLNKFEPKTRERRNGDVDLMIGKDRIG